MALKRKISSADYDKLDDATKALYAKDGDSYKLDLEDDDNGKLLRAKDREKQRADELQEKLDAEKKARKEAEDKLTDDETVSARKKGDIESIEKSWQKKIDKATEQFNATVAGKDKQLNKLLVEQVANSIANEISTAPKVMLPHIMRRLSADLTGEEAVTRVLDNDGKPSALTVQELANEFRNDASYKAIIIESKGSGSGAAGGDKGFSGAGGAKKYKDMSESEKVKLYKENPTELARLQAEEKQVETQLYI